MPDRTYSDEEVREILRRAAEKSGHGSGLSRQELIEAAGDVGIEASAVDDAIGALDRDREVDAEMAVLRQGERKSLGSSIVTWGIIAAGLLVMRFFDAGGWWFVWPMGVWAVLLLLRLKGFLLADPAADRHRAERNIEQRRQQKELRAARESRVRVADEDDAESGARESTAGNEVRG